MNIFDIEQYDFQDEIIETITETSTLRIERIISTGQTSPEGVWYDQSESEWILLLQGEAKLEFENGEIIILITGDYYMIPPHKKHRVAYTSTSPQCIWLCIFGK